MYRLLTKTMICIAFIFLIAASALLLNHSSNAEPARGEGEDAKPGWNGQPITHRCHAAINDLTAFRATLAEHEKTLIGFRHKIRHGVISYGELDQGRLKTAAPQFLLGKITENLRALDTGARTWAILYDLGLWNGQYSLCVWLISTNGVEAAETVPILQDSIFGRSSAATLLRSALRVAARAARRTPRFCALSMDQIAPEYRNLTRPDWDVWEQRIYEARTLLLPLSVAARLEDSNAKRLVILPFADIGSVPFAAMPLGGQQLVDRFALVLLPDVEALLGVSSPPRPWRSEPVSIVVGNPDLPPEDFPPLPGAQTEAVEVAELTGVKPLLGAEATKTEVIGSLREKRSDLNLIYLATHGCSDPLEPMDGSFLALAGGHLYGHDIKELIFPSNPLVVMSACQTGLGKVFEGGTFGLVRAWYHVGAPQIVMSLWNIDDAATKHIMTQFMRQVRNGSPTEFALQRALLAERAINTDPALWAGIGLFGLPTSLQPEDAR